ncbi:MAG: hypothetical protein IR160_02095 [Salinibacterium sp.]|nr:hypothetical protein [Salinibacterium sp.]MBF0671359.1 hypothetical protein [Salinibacterium sp.]
MPAPKVELPTEPARQSELAGIACIEDREGASRDEVPAACSEIAVPGGGLGIPFECRRYVQSHSLVNTKARSIPALVAGPLAETPLLIRKGTSVSGILAGRLASLNPERFIGVELTDPSALPGRDADDAVPRDAIFGGFE